MMANGHNQRILLTGAQTGGHLYPAVALGEWLQARGLEVVLVTSGEAAEADVLKSVSIETRTLKVGRLKGMGLSAKLKGIGTLPVGLLRALIMVRQLSPAAVVGFGGFTSGPVVLAAAALGIPTAICEENSIPGLTNRLLARVAGKVFVAYEEAAIRMKASGAIRTGVPVRPAIIGVPAKAYKGRGRRILVLGGSQGSRFLNRQLPPVLKEVAASAEGIEILHQTGRGNGSEVRAAYDGLGVVADVREYLDDVAAAYSWADIVVARSGAGTVSEIAAIGLPALFVPFAAATDDHQAANAKPLVDAGAALMIREGDFVPGSVATSLIAVLSDATRLQAMALASRGQGRRDSLAVMGAEVLALVSNDRIQRNVPGAGG
jgi:UDP-N-acetylglucosamine--N-acetylmuramyl-(pentapeptide) pyrophosphoryl-undecaprenol N-acetylglucosamine transferase